jgi:hypothetical protein
MSKFGSDHSVKESKEYIKPFYRCWDNEEYFRLDFSQDARFIFAITRAGNFSLYATRDLGLKLRCNFLTGEGTGGAKDPGLAKPGTNQSGVASGNQTVVSQPKVVGQTSLVGRAPQPAPTKNALVNMVVCQLNPFLILCLLDGPKIYRQVELTEGVVSEATDLEYPRLPGRAIDLKLNHREDMVAVAFNDADTQEPKIMLHAVDFGRRTFTAVRLAVTFSSIKFIDFSFDNFYLMYYDDISKKDYYINLNERVATYDPNPRVDIHCLNEGVLHSALKSKLKQFYHENNRINCIVKFSDSVAIVTDSFGTLRVFESESDAFKTTQVYTQHLNDAHICRLSADQSLLMVSSRVDRAICLWRVVEKEGGPN